MKTRKTILKEQDIIIEITCNNCGATAVLDEWIELNKMHSFKIDFEYGSKFDCEMWDFDLCDDCLEKIVNNFKIKPEKFDDIPF